MRDWSQALQKVRLATGVGVRVAILDSGVNLTLPRLLGTTGEVIDCRLNQSEFVAEKLSGQRNFDRNGHGSLVQSCFVKAAPHASVDHYRILDEQNRCDIALLCYTLDHVLEQNYSVVHLSLGTRNEEYIPWLVSIMKRAYEKNIIIVSAGSNIGNVLYPARFTYCLSVDACHSNDPLYVRYTDRSVIEVSGWGIDVEVDENESRVTGSSFAAAHVSGVVARMIEAYGPLSMVEVKNLLKLYSEQIEGGPESLVRRASLI